jgi:hypothetical protein
MKDLSGAPQHRAVTHFGPALYLLAEVAERDSSLCSEWRLPGVVILNPSAGLRINSVKNLFFKLSHHPELTCHETSVA